MTWRERDSPEAMGKLSLETVLQRARTGATPRVTVRRLLELHGKARRGSRGVLEIREALAREGLTTYPDFAAVHIDAHVEVCRLDQVETNDDFEPTTTVPDPWGTGLAMLEAIAEELEQEKVPRKVTVQEFMGWFGVLQRQQSTTERLQSALGEFSLATSPDFRDLSTESDFQFVPLVAEPEPERSDPNDAAAAGPEDPPVLLTGEFSRDPVFRIGALKRRSELYKVAPNAPIEAAVHLMSLHRINQVAVMSDLRTVRGVVTWRAICDHLRIGGKVTDEVRLCQTSEFEVVDASDGINEVAAKLLPNGFVFLRGLPSKEIVGIVTVHDLSDEFLVRLEPFLQLEEIENHLRKLLDGQVTVADLRSIARAPGPARVKTVLTDLDFSEYIHLLGKAEIWGKVGLPDARDPLLRELDAIRQIRNAFAHFAPDRLDEHRRRQLARFALHLRHMLALQAKRAAEEPD